MRNCIHCKKELERKPKYRCPRVYHCDICYSSCKNCDLLNITKYKPINKERIYCVDWIILFTLISLVIVSACAQYKLNYAAYDSNSYDYVGKSFINFYSGVDLINSLAIRTDFADKKIYYDFMFLSSTNNVSITFNLNELANYCEFWHDADQTKYPLYNGSGTINFNVREKTIFASLRCDFNLKSPNGGIAFWFANHTNTEYIEITKADISVSYDRSKYGCKSFCVTSETLTLKDVREGGNKVSAILFGQNLKGQLNFQIRTYSQRYKFLADVAFAVFTGLIVSLMIFIAGLVQRKYGPPPALPVL